MKEMRESRDNRIPEFDSLEEEKAYWEAEGPLAEGKKGRINKPSPRANRSSFLAVRLTGEELTRLRDMAAKRGVGTSTFARQLLISAMKHDEQAVPDLISDDTVLEVKSLVSENRKGSLKFLKKRDIEAWAADRVFVSCDADTWDLFGKAVRILRHVEMEPMSAEELFDMKTLVKRD